MWTYPGKKLLFMGGELAQPTEWADGAELPWHLQEQAPHQGVQRLVRDLNGAYRDCAALHTQDVDAHGFAWIAHDDAAQSVIAFQRRGSDGSVAVVVCNFTPVPRAGYRIGVPRAGAWRTLINTDAAVYGGSNVGPQSCHTEPVGAHQASSSLVLTLPPLACVVLVPCAE